MLRKEQRTPQSSPLLFQASEGFPCVLSTLSPCLSSQHAWEAVCTRTANSHELRRAESTASSPQAGVPSWPGDLSVNDQFAPHRHWSLSEISLPVVIPWGLAGGRDLGGEKLSLSLKTPTNPFPSWEGTRQSDTLVEPIWHTRKQLMWLSIFHSAS